MKTRPFGTQKNPISEVGLGCWQFGGDFGPMPEERAMKVMSIAVENGINFFDTADVYGAGRSETLIGKFLKSHSGDPLRVVTKFGRAAGVFPDGYTEAAMRESVDASRERLGVDSIDCLQLHCVPPEVLADGQIFDWLRALKSEGAIREFGASVETISEGLTCLKQDGLASLQVIFNIFRQKLITDLLPQAKAAGASIIVRLPLASGMLAGKYRAETTFAEGDHRNYNRDGQAFSVGETFAGIPFGEGIKLVEELREMLPDSMSMAQAAQRWILDHDAVTTLITGASTPEQAKENATVSTLPSLDRETHEKLSTFYQSKVEQHIRGAYE
jgi:aryl-alcohol dehydrogenase-like predicted oxidoreductase